jgi:hypothetical protein
MESTDGSDPAVGSVEEEEEEDPTVELTDEDLRPSQPAPPAITPEVGPPDYWDDTTPYVSSIDGVEVDPSPPRQPDEEDETR